VVAHADEGAQDFVPPGEFPRLAESGVFAAAVPGRERIGYPYGRRDGLVDQLFHSGQTEKIQHLPAVFRPGTDMAAHKPVPILEQLFELVSRRHIRPL